eukprot:7184194-Pyramimonas_sp.AAC.1
MWMLRAIMWSARCCSCHSGCRVQSIEVSPFLVSRFGRQWRLRHAGLPTSTPAVLPFPVYVSASA